MARRLFPLYALTELAVLVVLVATIGVGWTLLLVLGAFLLGLVLAGSQVSRHIRGLRAGLTVEAAPRVAVDSILVALGSVLVVVPGIASSVLGALLLLPPTRAAARPLLTAIAARRVPLITVAGAARSTAVRGDYIDGEVVGSVEVDLDVPTTADTGPKALERRPD
ncbi:fxsA cytoplasmic membrane family protein [Mycolicibacterium hassiacum DSM 44199]|uniref:FxsA cytoplasmic membrane family protein n=1 Tax=Mycolicibacterium hassiacum (strain DSM 44199 / CIP 105218 / JCM 12690 / 3849) TaxID=1122247 RepID=K5BF01_MYCHD|nr:FxsA family protein [Mycolicibacterium hassiacum]EKF23462.1 fxsA cytoplasmic membrane family protein [Mycolicibacterium hassiacum DSM 44199]MDA4084718.1 exlusion protein FxsA [Mycolicibacterium hassiacum DSM 44199]VCT89939.1 hypothetical protein MHAS_01639 [Mycolicibacterium hassiacum DSM 44199]